MSSHSLQVYSEIGPLKRVLLHRPGEEIENLTPELMRRLLFDDIPYLKIARQEHDAFADIFRKNNVEVAYVEDLIGETLSQDKALCNAFLDEFLDESGIKNKNQVGRIKSFLLEMGDTRQMIDKMIAGIRREEIHMTGGTTLLDMIESDYPFLIDPMPNLYFTRDPFAVIGSGVCLNHMRTVTRRRETLFSEYILKYHPDYQSEHLPFWYDRRQEFSIEGGDILVLSERVIAIGVSERTEPDAIETLAKNIFSDGQPFDTILAFVIPKMRAFMHLDTVFTMVDHDVFTIHPEIEGPLTVYSLTREKDSGHYHIEKETYTLEDVLKKHLELDSVRLIRCGGRSGIDAGREQWNDGSNTLAIAPGEVIVYARNHVTNKILESEGIKLHEIPSSELSRGRGGPRCMSLPLYRERIRR
jgi:arginine deiminase